MTEEKDDFLREIDELLGDIEDDPNSTITPLANGSTHDKAMGDVDPELEETFKVLSVHSNHLQAAPKTGIAALKEAITAHQDIEVIRGLFEGGKVPDEVRADLWKECLNVSRRPDSLGNWSGPLDCENQDTIHKQCLDQAGKLVSSAESRSTEDLAQDMELVITFYCKSRNLRYSPDCGWPELLLPFVSLSMSRADLFNCFYAMMAKYIPKECKMDGKPFYLFRLLLLYHDPELCSFLDTKKLSPDKYLQPWLRSLFVSPCVIGVTKVMWDHYLMERDPFFFFFLALVMVVNAKELLMQDSAATSDAICATISTLPCHLNAEDIDDFFSLAQYYATRTPQSFRKDYHSLLFGSGRGLTSLGTSISHALCLPISLQEVMEVNQREHFTTPESSPMQYSIVDCRPLEHFSCGHLPDSHSLDANLLLHSPNDFTVAAERLCSRLKQRKEGLEGGEHICFLGSGRQQEDQYVTMVVAKFLQKSIPYVSLARGGFLELSSLLNNRMDKVLEDYDPSRCQELYSDDSGCAMSTRSDASDSDSEGYTRYRQKLQTKGARLYAQMASGFSKKSQHFKAKFGNFLSTPKKAAEERHVSQLDKPSKRYRNVHADVFVIADEDDNENPSASSSDEEVRQEMVNISLFSGNPDITHSFPATEMKDGREYHSHILLSSNAIVVLRELSDRAGWGRVKYRHPFDYVLKITAKKKNPDVITFRFGTGTGENVVITDQLRLRIPNTSKATSAIKNQIIKYQEIKKR